MRVLLLQMILLPGIDLIYADPGFIVDKKDNLLGIVLTHAHEDHIGAITYVWKKLNVKFMQHHLLPLLLPKNLKKKN